jgi:hypothetical protein
MKFNTLLLLCSLLFLASEGKAQMEVQKKFEGRVFFDSAKTKIKEAYEYKVRYTMIINPRTNEPVMKDMAEVKNGLYIRYREDGTIDCTGFYRNDVACGNWKHYDEKGKNVVREETIEGECFVNDRK